MCLRPEQFFAWSLTALVAVTPLVGVAWQLDWDRLEGLGTAHAWFLLLVAAGLHLLKLPLKAAARLRAALAASLIPADGPSTQKILPSVMVGASLNLALASRVEKGKSRRQNLRPC